jgi:hypothetical protein
VLVVLDHSVCTSTRRNSTCRFDDPPFCCQQRQETFSFLKREFNEYRGYFTGVKWREREVDHLTPSSAQLMNGWSYTSTFPQPPFLRVVDREKSPFIFYTQTHTRIFYDRMTVHRNRFLVNKSNRFPEFQFYWYYYSIRFGKPFCLSSGVLRRTSALGHFMQW